VSFPVFPQYPLNRYKKREKKDFSPLPFVGEGLGVRGLRK
jgi:hypothetical protein